MTEAKRFLLKTWLALVALPVLMRPMVIFCLAGGLCFAVVPLCRSTSFWVHGERVAFSEFWSRGFGPMVVVTGLLLFGAGLLLLAKRWPTTTQEDRDAEPES